MPELHRLRFDRQRRQLGRWGHVGLAAATTLWLALLVRGARMAPGAPMEEGKLLVGARLVSAGRWPNEAFEHLYGPGDVWLVGGIFRLFGESVALERAVGMAATVALVASIAVIGGRVVRGAGLLGAVLAASVLAPFGVHAYSWTLGLAALATGVAMVGRSSSDRGGARCVAVSGVLCGMSLVFRPDLVVAVVLAGVVIARSADTASRRGRRWMAWVGVGASPWIVHLALVGPAAVVSGTVVDPVFRLRDGRSLPLPYRFSEPASALQRLELADAWPSPGVALSSGFLLALLVPLVVGAAVVVHRRSIAHERLPTNAEVSLYASSAVAVAILPQLLQRPDSAHFRFVLSVAVGLLPSAIGLSLRNAPPRRRRALGAAAAAVVALAAGSYSVYVEGAIDLALDPVDGAEVTHRGRSFPLVDRRTVEEVEALLARVDALTEPGDRVVVWTESLGRATYSETYLYYLLPGLVPATTFLEANPGLATRADSGFLDGVLDADLIVLSERFRGWDEPNGSRSTFAPGVRLEQEHLCSVGSTGPYELLRPCGRG